MKKTIAALFALAAAASFAGTLQIGFYTPGPDKYADGTAVLDGERYALVYTTETSQETVRIYPGALNGKCKPVVFFLDEEETAKYQGGTWGVYLLDTRDFAADATGKTLAAVVDGVPAVVNVKAAVKDGIAKTSGFGSAVSSEGVAPGAYDLAAANVPNPVVTGIKIEGANVIVTVKDTVPFVGYTLESGSNSLSFSVPEGIVSANGDDAGEITLVAPKKDNAQFFKVTTVK